LDKADLVVFNTCVVTQKAEKETRQIIRQLKRKNPRAKLIVAGCWVDMIDKFGGLIPKGIDQMISNEDKWRVFNLKDEIEAEISENRGLIRIQTGCSNQCAYCLPRLIRGEPKSVPIKKVISQVKALISQGVLEIVLTGQNISQYDDQGKDWIDLVEEVLEKTKVRLLRLGSVNPDLVEGKRANNFARKLIRVYQGTGKNRLARHLHLSLQSGSDRILSLMNRPYTVKQFADLVNVVRRRVEGINVTTDIIVGFPGETNKDFKETASFVKEMEFGKIHIFRYSKRKGTISAEKGKEWGEIDESVIKERARLLADLEKKLRLRFWRSQIGQRAMAVVWQDGKGLSDNYIPITIDNVKGKEFPGIFKIRFTEANRGAVSP